MAPIDPREPVRYAQAPVRYAQAPVRYAQAPRRFACFLSLFLAAAAVGCGGSAPAEGEGGGDAAGAALATANLPEGLEHVHLTAEELVAIRLETATAEPRRLAAHLSAMGRVLANRYRQAIVSYPFPARIAEIHAREGEWVGPGDSLVVLQSEEVGEATAAFYTARADYELAQVDFERENQLFESGVAARKNLTTAETNLRVAEATLNAAEKKLHVMGFSEEQIQTLQESHQVNPIITLFAPISGKITENTMVLGGMVEEATEIMTIMDPSRHWVEADIYEGDVARVSTGQHVVVSVPALGGEEFRGQITYVGDILDPDTRTITVRTEVNNPEEKLKPGMFADLAIQLSLNGEALSVPSAAVLDDEGSSLVFVRIEQDVFEPRHVTLGVRENGWVEVTSGLEAGEEVVVNGNFQLKSKLYEAVLEAGHVH
jgi:cobalt-zinc-cadmium efflux system membrane fusion protein